MASSPAVFQAQAQVSLSFVRVLSPQRPLPPCRGSNSRATLFQGRCTLCCHVTQSEGLGSGHCHPVIYLHDSPGSCSQVGQAVGQLFTVQDCPEFAEHPASLAPEHKMQEHPFFIRTTENAPTKFLKPPGGCLHTVPHLLKTLN